MVPTEKFAVGGNLSTMACGLPFIIAAQLAFPNRQCVAFVGDGGFTMLMGEFAIELHPIDFVRVAEACGGVGFACARPEEVGPALAAAWRISDRPALVEATIDNDAEVSPPDAYFASLKEG
jgi:pyruvate dehydrogenase (quinone)